MSDFLRKRYEIHLFASHSGFCASTQCRLHCHVCVVHVLRSTMYASIQSQVTKIVISLPPRFLPKGWITTLPPEDHLWVSLALYNGKNDLRELQSWYYPPLPATKYTQPPSPVVFFHHRLFLWLPYRLHDFPLVCSEPGCNHNGLQSAVRSVADWVHDYYMGTEYLECCRCNKKVPGWSLDNPQAEEFPLVVLYQLVLNKMLLLELRDRSLGNTPSLPGSWSRRTRKTISRGRGSKSSQ